MRILFATESFYPHGSGAELATYLYGDLLSKEDIDVIVLTNRFPGDPSFSKEGSLQIYRLPLFETTGSLKYSALKRLDVLASSLFNKLLSWADVVYVPRFWFTAIAWAKAHGKPVVVHMHDYISVCSLSSLYDETESKGCVKTGILCSPKCVFSFETAHGRGLGQTISSMFLNSTVGRYLPKLMMLADAVICVSSRQKELIVERASPFRGKTHVIYNPFPDYSDLEISGDDFGYFGGPDVLKGFRVLFKAVNRINSGKPKIHCTKFKTSNQEFEREVGEMGFSLYKRLEIAELEQLYRKLKSVIVPSIWNEPWPYVVVEALIRGRFVIASRIGGMPEQLEGCRGAILCEPGDSKMLAESIEHVHSLSRDEIVDLGFQNKESFLRRFNNDSSVKKFISLCENLT
jgi:glycosyltransferase involved in cell wall biosynthesis